MDTFTFRNLVKAALTEDIGSGDVTSLILDGDRTGRGYFLAKQELVLCGSELARMSFTELDGGTEVEFGFRDGDLVPRGSRIGTASGRLRSLLTSERVALNFMQRLSAIATVTRAVAEKVKPFGIRVLDTRKTTPLLRALEKYAVRTGGGHNHRFNLSDGILIKDNHIQAAGSISEAVKRAFRLKTALLKIEVEVKNLEELREALDAGADHIMLDNMAPADIEKAVAVVHGRAAIEVSGGINPGNILNYAISGVDYISLGFITHSAGSVDISFEIE